MRRVARTSFLTAVLSLVWITASIAQEPTGPTLRVALLDADLSVDGTIEIERLGKVVHVGRPTYGQSNSTVGLFRLLPNGNAERVQVALGRSSASEIEIVRGLEPGDVVILSDMSRFDGVDRVRVR